jgi:hypothetical protein
VGNQKVPVLLRFGVIKSPPFRAIWPFHGDLITNRGEYISIIPARLLIFRDDFLEKGDLDVIGDPLRLLLQADFFLPLNVFDRLEHFRNEMLPDFNEASLFALLSDDSQFSIWPYEIAGYNIVIERIFGLLRVLSVSAALRRLCHRLSSEHKKRDAS